jgi:hypothetical protein
MASRCPSCNKFASLELQEVDGPESEELDTESGIITVEVKVVVASACCGDEMKEYNAELDSDVSAAIDAYIDATLEEEGLDLGDDDPDLAEEAERRATELREGLTLEVAVSCEEGSEGKATTFTATATCTVTAADGDTVATEELAETFRASDMDELY